MTLNKKNSLQEIEEALILATSNTNAALHSIYYNDEIYDLFYEFVDEWEELECDPEGVLLGGVIGCCYSCYVCSA